MTDGTGRDGGPASGAPALGPRSAARSTLRMWAASWVGTMVVAWAWLVSLSPVMRVENPLSSGYSNAVLVVSFTAVPALVGLLVPLAPDVPAAGASASARRFG